MDGTKEGGGGVGGGEARTLQVVKRLGMGGWKTSLQ